MPEKQGVGREVHTRQPPARGGGHRERREGAPFISSTQNNSYAAMIHAT